MNPEIKLVALDLDGTLFSPDSTISEGNKQMIKKAIQEKDTIFVLSSGRPYTGLPLEAAKELGIRYGITANGAGVYELESRTCIYEECIEETQCMAMFAELNKLKLRMDIFIEGEGYSQGDPSALLGCRNLPASVRNNMMKTRTHLPDIAAYVKEHNLSVQKMTLNFFFDENGRSKEREHLVELVNGNPDLTAVCGGFNNLEITRGGVTKATGLRKLCEYLHIDVANSMAIGDSGNDLDMMLAAGVGVAMANATEDVLSQADYITRSNTEDGVAHAVSHFIFES